MAALSETKAAIVRKLVETAPDGIVGTLRQALATTGDDGPLGPVLALVEGEARDRRLRNIIMAPVVPLCVAQDDAPLAFPLAALAGLWRGLKGMVPKEIASLLAGLEAPDAPPPSPALCDALLKLATEQFRTRRLRDFRVAAEACDLAGPEGAARFAACLDLAPIVRRSIPRLSEWLTHADDETNAAVRLAYKDAVEIAPDAGPRFFEMLAAHLGQRWRVLQLISAVMDKPTERFLAESEFRAFPERLLAEVDNGLRAFAQLDKDGGAAAGRAAGRGVDLIGQQIHELDTDVALARDHGWGKRVLEQKRTLAETAENMLQAAEKATYAVLPTQTLGFARQQRRVPRLDARPDPAAVKRAITLLAFADEVRSSVDHAGFCAAHTRLEEKLAAHLDQYVEEVLDLVRTGDGVDRDIAHAFLLVAADFCQLIRGERSADLIRRRAASACHDEPPGDDSATAARSGD